MMTSTVEAVLSDSDSISTSRAPNALLRPRCAANGNATANDRTQSHRDNQPHAERIDRRARHLYARLHHYRHVPANHTRYDHPVRWPADDYDGKPTRGPPSARPLARFAAPRPSHPIVSEILPRRWWMDANPTIRLAKEVHSARARARRSRLDAPALPQQAPRLDFTRWRRQGG